MLFRLSMRAALCRTHAKWEKLCIVPSIVFCTGRVPFLYETYATHSHTLAVLRCVHGTRQLKSAPVQGKGEERAISLKIWHTPAPSLSSNATQPRWGLCWVGRSFGKSPPECFRGIFYSPTHLCYLDAQLVRPHTTLLKAFRCPMWITHRHVPGMEI